MSENREVYQTGQHKSICAYCGLEQVKPYEHSTPMACVSALQDEAEKMERQMAHLQRQLEGSQGALSTAIGELGKVREELESERAVNRAYQSEIDKMTSVEKQLAEANNKVDTLTVLFNNTQIALHQSDTAKEQAEAERDRLNNYFDCWKDEIVKRQRLEQQLAVAQAWEAAAREALQKTYDEMASGQWYGKEAVGVWANELEGILVTSASAYAERMGRMKEALEAWRAWSEEEESGMGGPLFERALELTGEILGEQG